MPNVLQWFGDLWMHHGMHMPCTCHAHNMHMACTLHAHNLHMEWYICHAIHIACTCHAHSKMQHMSCIYPCLPSCLGSQKEACRPQCHHGPQETKVFRDKQRALRSNKTVCNLCKMVALCRELRWEERPSSFNCTQKVHQSSV